MINKSQHSRSSQFRSGTYAGRMGGMTMIELLIAMVMGLSLTVGVMQVYVGNNEAERDQEARARMQENGRFAINYIARELRMAGYLGCLATINQNSINNILNAPPASFQPITGLQGWEANGTAPGAVYNSANNVAVVSTGAGGWATTGGNVLDATNAVPGSDIFRVWSSDGTGAVINSITPGATIVVNSRNLDIDDGDILLLSNCERADIVHACDVQSVGGVSLNSLLSATCGPSNLTAQGLRTGPGGEITKLKGTIFYVGKRGNVATNPPALFRRQLGTNALAGNPEELVEGIESIQILYGVNADNDNKKTVDAYVPASQVADWSRVISARVSVLVQSVEDNILPAPQAYTFNGINYNGTFGNGALPGDRRLRRVFTTLVTLRNRAVGS